MRSGPKLLSLEKTPAFVFSSGPKPVKSGCGVSGPVFDPDVFVSGALFSVDDRSTLSGSENDMSMNQCLKGFEEEPVLGDTPPQPFGFFAGSGALTLKGASRDSNLGTDGRAASGNAQRAEIALLNAVPAGSGALVPSPVGTGRSALRARRRLRLTGVFPRQEFESCFEARGRVITCDFDLATLSLSSSRVPCSSASAVSVGLSRGRVISGSASCVRCGGALFVGSGAL